MGSEEGQFAGLSENLLVAQGLNPQDPHDVRKLFPLYAIVCQKPLYRTYRKCQQVHARVRGCTPGQRASDPPTNSPGLPPTADPPTPPRSRTPPLTVFGGARPTLRPQPHDTPLRGLLNHGCCRATATDSDLGRPQSHGPYPMRTSSWLQYSFT